MRNKLNILVISFVSSLFLYSGAFAADTSTDGWTDKVQASTIQETTEKGSLKKIQNDSLFNKRDLVKTNSCGFAPFPPFGCKNPTCMCDERGQNCHWIFQCK